MDDVCVLLPRQRTSSHRLRSERQGGIVAEMRGGASHSLPDGAGQWKQTNRLVMVVFLGRAYVAPVESVEHSSNQSMY